MKAIVAVAIPDLVGESFDLFEDGGFVAIMAKREVVLLLWAEVGSLNLSLGWEASTERSQELILRVWGPWRLLERVYLGHVCSVAPMCSRGNSRPRRRAGRGGRSEFLCCRPNAVVSCARDTIYMVKGT